MMKRIYLILAFAALTAVSCENAGYLDKEPFSQTSPENFYKSESDMYLALVSCYEMINSHKIPGKSYSQRGSYAQGLLYIMNAPSDDIVAAQSATANEGLEMEWGNFIESNVCIRDFWKTFYVGINRCNIILAYIDGVSMAEDMRVRYKAEARFMRAFFYYHLAWNFGGVPVVTDYASTGSEPRASLEKVYELILDDLDFAFTNMTGTGILGNSSANRYTAAAYIGRICNYLAACKRSGIGKDLVSQQPLNDFAWVDEDAMTDKALNALKVVVEESSYKLIDDYTNLFRETTKEEQYRECLLLAELPLSGAEGYWPNSFYLPSPSSSGAIVPGAYGGRHVPTPKAFYTYHKDDMRRDHNCTGRTNDGVKEKIVGGYTYADPAPPQQTVIITTYFTDQNGKPIIDPATGNQKFQKDTIPHPLYDSPTQTYLPVSGMQSCPGKVRLVKVGELQHTYQQHAFSYPLMRLADVYLMYAEALYFDGNESEGRVWMDKVLKRASTSEENYQILKAAYHRDDFVQELLESRQRELIFEFSRKWDLIRFNMIDEAIAGLEEDRLSKELHPQLAEIEDKYLEYSSGSISLGTTSLKQNWQHHKIWLPISEEQIGVNRNLVQNAGWGAGTTLTE